MAAGLGQLSFSWNEVAALAAKAARGAGADAGQAAVFGAALVRHLGQARDTGEILDALESLPRGPIHAGPLLCRAKRAEASTFDTRERLPQGVARSYAETVGQPGTSPLEVTTLDQSYTLGADEPAPMPERLTLPTPLLTRLNRLAKETYVPNSDASRAGAGAGTSDND
ncbi:hypothetical protein [Pseudaestuariivita sp.]|uniref:hypothetical protein n=1 Tax=Pseudaestuariivita sp. TaxID=2211669 RepID=UPI004059B62F